jgi:acetoacetyl-CoA synthetase
MQGWDQAGNRVKDGEQGDLVVVKPFPAMPVYFWGDESGKKYRDAYFSKFDGVWYHGDFIEVNAQTGGVVMQVLCRKITLGSI